MRRSHICWLLAALAPIAQDAAARGRPSPASRPMTVEDLLSIENLSTIELSPDGAWAAIVIQRARRDSGYHGRTRLGGDDRGDVWLSSTRTAERKRITDGAADGSGYWSPSWSPDGKRLAMLTSRGRTAARLLVWSMESGTLETASEHGVHVGAAVDVAGARGFGFAWIDATRLVAVLVPNDFRPFDFGGDHETTILAPRAWERAIAGKEATASVVESGAKSEPWAGRATVAVIDAARKQTFPVAEVGVALLSAPQVSVSPNRDDIAVFETAPTPPPAVGRQLGFAERGATRVGFARAGAEPGAPRWCAGLERPSLDHWHWSPDGAAAAALGAREPGAAENALFLVDRASGEARRATPAAMNVRSFLWLDAKRLLAQGAMPTKDGAPLREAAPLRGDWWVVETGAADPAAAPRNLTAPMMEPPGEMVRCANGILAAVADGGLWRIHPDGVLTKLPRPTPLGPVRAIAPVRSQPAIPALDPNEIVVEAGEPPALTWYRYAMDTEMPTPELLPVPSVRSTMDGHWLAQRALVVKFSDPRGGYAWHLDLEKKQIKLLASVNAHLADVAAAQRLVFDYQGSGGEALKGLAILPPDYKAGNRLPVLTWVYAGDVIRSERSQRLLSDKHFDSALNFLPLVSRGFVVLVPSLPIAAEGKGSDPMADLKKGLFGAVDKLIEMGIADAERLAVGGHSYGGYTTFCLVTQTNRFKAAIAMAGQTDLFATYGTFDARFRYQDSANEGISRMRWAEGGQGRMGAPPYGNAEAYFRNSPMSAVDKVETPILILHGDLDFVPISQAEEFYSALYRLGKPARFVRYFGEGHSIESPANIRHLWDEVFRWLDTRLATKPESRASK